MGILLLVFHKYSNRMQRIFIPTMITICLMESIASFTDWFMVNSYGHRNVYIFLPGIFMKSYRDSFVGITVGYISRMGNLPSPWRRPQKVHRDFVRPILRFWFYLWALPQDPNCDGTLGYTAGKHTTGHPQCHDLVYGPLFYPQTAERPVTAETEVQTEVVRSFGWILGIAASVYVVWGITENTLKCLYTKDTIWEFAWVFIAMWDLIFVLVVMSMMCEWTSFWNAGLLLSDWGRGREPLWRS